MTKKEKNINTGNQICEIPEDFFRERIAGISIMDSEKKKIVAYGRKTPESESPIGFYFDEIRKLMT